MALRPPKIRPPDHPEVPPTWARRHAGLAQLGSPRGAAASARSRPDQNYEIAAN